MTQTLPNITFSSAESWVINFAFKEADQETPLDLTGATIDWALGADYGEDPLLSASIGTGITVTNESLGLATLSLSPTDPTAGHSSIPPGDYVHECRVTLASGVVSIQLKGPFTVLASLF